MVKPTEVSIAKAKVRRELKRAYAAKLVDMPEDYLLGEIRDVKDRAAVSGIGERGHGLTDAEELEVLRGEILRRELMKGLA